MLAGDVDRYTAAQARDKVREARDEVKNVADELFRKPNRKQREREDLGRRLNGAAANLGTALIKLGEEIR